MHACAQVEVKKHDNSFGIVTARRTYYVRADSRHEADDWVLKINRTRKEQEARLQAEKEQQQNQNNNDHTPIAGTPFSGPSETDLPQSIEQQAQLPVPGASAASAVPIPISGGRGLAPSTFISSASDSAGFLSTSASSSAGGDYGAAAGAGGLSNYLSSSWASSSSEQSNPSVQPGAFGRTGTFRVDSTSTPSGTQSAVSTQKWPDIPVNVGDGLLSTDGGLVDDPRLLPAADPHATVTRDRAQQSNILSSSEEDEAPTPSGPHSTSPPRPAAATGTAAAVQTSPSGPAAAGGSGAATANPQRVILAGYLMKQGKRKSWRKRWFSLYSNRLVYTRSHMVSAAPLSISVEVQAENLLPNSLSRTGKSTERSG